jgi:hypothetical protein
MNLKGIRKQDADWIDVSQENDWTHALINMLIKFWV